MKWNIQIDKIALNFIAKQPAPQRVRIMDAIAKLPEEGDIKPMAGQIGFYRLRVGTYRIIYMVKEEIITVARQIDTFDTSILPFEDCCTVFTPKHPKTKPELEKVMAEERKLPFDELVGKALSGMDTKHIAYDD